MPEDKKHLSFSHLIDLIHAGPEMAAKMKQYPQMQESLPELYLELEELARRLDALGVSGWDLLGKSPRIKAVFIHYLAWKEAQHPRPPLVDHIRFVIEDAAFVRHESMELKTMKRIAASKKDVELCLQDQCLYVTCGSLNSSISARYESKARMWTRGGFIRIMLDCLKKDKRLDCEIDGTMIKINGAIFKPGAA